MNKRVIVFMILILIITLSIIPTQMQAYDPGTPSFSGNGAVAEPVSYTVGNMMQAIYNAESGGTNFWMDRMLARPGVEPSAGNNDLLTKGRCFFMKDHTASKIGFGGNAAYMEETNVAAYDAYVITFSNGTYTENTSKRVNYPSFWTSEYNYSNINVFVKKFITFNNVAVTYLTIKNNGTGSATFNMNVSAPHATSASGSELTGTYPCFRSLITVNTRLSGDSMTVSGSTLTRSITLAAGATLTTKVQMVYTTSAIPESLTEYNTYKGYTPDTAFATHVKAYNQWWAENIPYIDLPDTYMKKIAYYRLWLNRYNFLDANLPGTPWGYPTSVEGVDGYNNNIPVSLCYQIQDNKYFRDPMYVYGSWLDSGQNANNGMYWCDPASDHWGSTRYENFISDAGWNAYRLHGGPNSVVSKFATYAENDAKGQLAYWSGASNLISFTWNAETGNDADSISFLYYNRANARPESAFVYAGFIAAQKMYTLAGNTSKASSMATSAASVQSAVLNNLWDNTAKVFKNRDNLTGNLIPWKEDQVYTPFTYDLVPTSDTNYREAFKLWNTSSNEFYLFPCYTSNQNDRNAAISAGNNPGNNFSTLNASVSINFFINAMRKYPSSYLTTDMFKKLLTWMAWAQCIDGNATYPDANEYWANWNTSTKNIGYRSWIHHNVLGSYSFALFEGIGGIVPREDNQIELWPIDIGYDHFAFNNIKYHGNDMTVIWDSSGSNYGVPAGYSVYLNGIRMFTVSKLVHLIWNSVTGSITYPDGGGATTSYNVANTSFPAANQVALSGRIITYLQKAGVSITGATPSPTPTVTPTPTATPSPTNTGTPTPTGAKTPTPTKTATPTPTGMATPTPTPGTSGIKVQMYNSNMSATTNMIYPQFKLFNTGTGAITLSNVKIRYYYTIDGVQAQSFWCDYSQVGSSNVTGTFVTMATSKTGADTYLEVGFTSGAGNLAAGANIDIQTRFAKTDWSNYNQTNDYSFNSSATSYVDWTKVTGYFSGALQWGTEP